MQTSKIKTLIHQGEKEWNGKKLQKWLIVFENDENGTYTQFPDNQNPVIGQEMTYTIEDKGYGPEIKTQKAGGAKGGGGWNRKSPEETAMINTIALAKSAIESGQLKLQDVKIFVTEFHQFFVNYNNGQGAPAQTDAQVAQAVPTQPDPAAEDNALPF